MLSIKDTDTDSLKQIDADVVLIAVGRKPNTSGLGLEELGLATDKHGFIEINNKFESSIKNIYAIGDVIKGPMLAHKAEEDGVAAVEIINGEIIIGEKKHDNVKDSTLILLSKGDDLKVRAKSDAKFLVISGKPINEEIARGGPFVMNTKAEILQAVQDYHNDTFVK